MNKLVIIIIFLINRITALADINGDLNNYFNKLGYATNTTAPNVYKGQDAGYYTGGSVFARNSVNNIQISSVDLPSMRSGCGGIDLYTGGFSFINSQQLVHAMKNILNNTAGYAFNLALDSATPELANAMKYMNTLANTVNNTNINTCETSAGLVGSVWPKTQVAQQQVCQDVGTGSGIFSDYAAARQGCGAGGKAASTLNNATGAYKNLVFKGNVAWQALQSNDFTRSDPELAELFMSLSGTVIVASGTSDTANQQYKVLPSLATNASLLRALLHGGEANIYACNDLNNCLNPTIRTITISTQDALGNQVSTMLNDMVDKIYTDEKLTTPEIGLLNATSLPLYKILNVQAAFAGNKSVLDVNNYADVIATDILFQYLQGSLTAVKTGSMGLQYPQSVMNEFSKGVDNARRNVEALQTNAYQQMAMAAQLINQTQGLEKMLSSTLATNINNNLNWANHIKRL